MTTINGTMPAENDGVKMRHHYSWDLRERVIYQNQELGKSSHEIALDLDMSLRAVQQTLQIWNEIGDITWDPKKYCQRG
jgi:transposase